MHVHMFILFICFFFFHIDTVGIIFTNLNKIENELDKPKEARGQLDCFLKTDCPPPPTGLFPMIQRVGVSCLRWMPPSSYSPVNRTRISEMNKIRNIVVNNGKINQNKFETFPCKLFSCKLNNKRKYVAIFFCFIEHQNEGFK